MKKLLVILIILSACSQTSNKEEESSQIQEAKENPIETKKTEPEKVQTNEFAERILNDLPRMFVPRKNERITVYWDLSFDGKDFRFSHYTYNSKNNSILDESYVVVPNKSEINKLVLTSITNNNKSSWTIKGDSLIINVTDSTEVRQTEYYFYQPEE